MKQAVCILIENDLGQFLGVSRKNNYQDFGMPGGKVDPGETPDQAIIREVKEETGLDASNLCPAFISFCGTYEVITYIGLVSGEIVSSEEGIVKWIDKQDLLNGSFGDYNKRMFSFLKI